MAADIEMQPLTMTGPSEGGQISSVPQESSRAERIKDDLDAHNVVRARHLQAWRDVLAADYLLDQRREQIRVLEINAPTMKESDPIIATMRLIDLKKAAAQDSEHSYAALSYVWGDTSTSDPTISCCGTAVKVTRNCHMALWHIRETLGSFAIWVDAVCIDQGNELERDQQMALMPQIYGAAEAVYVWLGASQTATLRAMRYMDAKGLSRYISQPSDGEVKVRSLRAALSLFTPWGSSYPCGRGHKWTLSVAGITDLVDLLDCQWLQRMWTYQEMLFARNPIIVCGKVHVPYKTFQDTLLLLNTLRDKELTRTSEIWLGLSQARERMQSEFDDWKFSKKHKFVQRILHYRFIIRMVFHLLTAILLIGYTALSIDVRVDKAMWFSSSPPSQQTQDTFVATSVVTGTALLIDFALFLTQVGMEWKQRPSPISVGRIVDGICNRKASKRRDKVYGVLNVLRKLGADVPPGQAVPPGNTDNIDETDNTDDYIDDDLCWRFAIGLLGIENDAYILQLAANTHREDSDLPTWVPNWSLGLDNDLNLNHRLLDIDMQGYGISSQDKATLLYEAETRLNKIEIDQREKVLTISARELGTVIACIKFCKTNGALDEDSIEEQSNNIRAGILLSRTIRELVGGCKALHALADPEGTTDVLTWESWTTALATHSLKAVEADLGALARGDRHSGLYSWKFLASIHIPVCNLLAQLRCTVCTIRFDDEPTVQSMAFSCNRVMKPQDRVVRVCGLLRPLVVRRRMEEVATSVDLISTIYMKARKARHAGQPTALSWDQKFDFH